jgi:hypothetical protein
VSAATTGTRDERVAYLDASTLTEPTTEFETTKMNRRAWAYQFLMLMLSPLRSLVKFKGQNDATENCLGWNHANGNVKAKVQFP